MNRELQGASRTSMNEREDNVNRGSISLQCWVARVDLQTLQVDAKRVCVAAASLSAALGGC